jgi:hypothetical protein
MSLNINHNENWLLTKDIVIMFKFDAMFMSFVWWALCWILEKFDVRFTRQADIYMYVNYGL